MDISHIRKDYKLKVLDESQVAPGPYGQFLVWFEEALKSNVLEVNAMTLSTVSSQGRPSARIVLLKDFDELGFTFYTNYQSKKGEELLDNPFACLTFFWPELERQIRLEGETERVSLSESEAYFQSRPRESKIGAWASQQSQQIRNRSELESKYKLLLSRFADAEHIPKPEYWGGYRIQIDYAEFWQGRPNRLHDRISYYRKGDDWKISRLSP